MYLQLNYASSNVEVDSLTFISFQENDQTTEIYFDSYHVIPLNKTISNYCQLALKTYDLLYSTLKQNSVRDSRIRLEMS